VFEVFEVFEVLGSKGDGIPAVFTCMSVHREPTTGGPGSGWRQGRKRFLCQLPL
jgi:hypothetical protein